ncbi:MAG: cation:proton antiporter [Prevotellaceae bacterium]|nr:cation:proton antiporter [Prevotellaceae bacterium]MBF1062783.1 cation:proton antiporter [Prevotellaceae bacterium]
MPYIASYFPITNPTLIFFVVMLIILLAPVIMGKLRIPHIIGMVLAGVAIGPFGFNILTRDASFELFGRVGLYYIMFLASLEMDMEGLKRNKYRTLFFALLTFAIPFALMYAASISLLHYVPMAALLLGVIMSSNTLVSYPIVSRYGLQSKDSVTLSVGASMLSLLLSLICLAIIVASCNGTGDWQFWIVFIAKFAVYCVALIYFVPRVTRWFLRRYSDAVMQFIFIMGILFLSAALAELVGLEGIFGAFFSGIILNRFIPHVSPLMNRIEFIGNALFIPYFLIGVGMLINIRLLFQGGGIIWTVLCIVVFGTLGKAVAAYLSGWLFRLPRAASHMMFGLTSAHAAGAIAMVMVGMKLKTAEGMPVVDERMLNGIVIMILFTCIISSLITEASARMIIIRDKELPAEDNRNDDELMLIPVKYKEYACHLMDIALMMRNPKLGRNLVALNVVYDDDHMRQHQEEGIRLLEEVSEYASSSDVSVQTQVRIAANIANGIKHAFKEFRASEILIGMHMHDKVSAKFWGEFHQSLFNGLHRQIMMARLYHPLSTLRRIVVAVPSRAQYEPGFYRWLERLSRMAENIECRVQFSGRTDTLQIINQFITNRHPNVRAIYQTMEHWNELPRLATTIANDHLFVVVTARKGTVSYKTAMDHLPEELTKYFKGKNLMIIFPDQYGDDKTTMTFAQPQHTEERSAYEEIREWARRKRRLIMRK